MNYNNTQNEIELGYMNLLNNPKLCPQVYIYSVLPTNHDAVAIHISPIPQAPAIKLTNPVIFPGTPMPFSTLQCKANGAQQTLLTNPFFQALTSPRNASSFPSLDISTSLAFRNTCCLHSTTNCSTMCPNHARVLQIYHLSTPPQRSTKRFETTPLAARKPTFSRDW